MMTDEFAAEIDAIKAGLARLQAAIDEYHHAAAVSAADLIAEGAEASTAVAVAITPQPEHIHTDEPLIQCGWLGQTGRYYGLGESIDEPGGFSPVYRHWGEECGHPERVDEALVEELAAIIIRSGSLDDKVDRRTPS